MAASIAPTFRKVNSKLGYHLCYGDYQHQHFKQPADTTRLVEVANVLAERVGRPINRMGIHAEVSAPRAQARCSHRQLSVLGWTTSSMINHIKKSVYDGV